MDRKSDWKDANAPLKVENEFPVFKAPDLGNKISIEEFLHALHGPAHTGVPPGTLLSTFEPARIIAVDVRTAAEFEKGNIPGTLNLPLFTNEERVKVGTAYKQNGRYFAIRFALKFIGPRLPEFVKELEKKGLKEGGSIVVSCWRGGMRSGAVGWLLALLGFKVSVLDGGYRSYRRWCKSIVGEGATAPCPVIVLGGKTGSGKTAVLHTLKDRGEQVLDLEGIANHKGSAFGAMGMPPQPTNEMYENSIAMCVRRVDRSKRMWVEHEGGHVGRCLVPFGVLKWVKISPNGAFLVVDMASELRVRRLVQDYCSPDMLAMPGWADGLRDCIASSAGGLAKRLGPVRAKEATGLLEQGQWEKIATLMLEYYDKLYQKWADESESRSIVKVDCPSDDAIDVANRVQAALLTASIPTTTDTSETKTETVPETVTETKTETKTEPVTETLTGVNKLVQKEREVNYEGSCYCGEISLTISGFPKAVSYCHCSICRRLTGAPFTCQALFDSQQVHIDIAPGGRILSFPSSKGVERKRCGTCFAPVHGTLFGGKLTAVPLVLIKGWTVSSAQKGKKVETEPASSETTTEKKVPPLTPLYHMYYKDRVMDVVDGLPKYAGAVRPGPNRTSAGVLVPEVGVAEAPYCAVTAERKGQQTFE